MLKLVTINRVDSVSAGKVFACISFSLGLFLGMFYGAIAVLGMGMSSNSSSPRLGIGIILGIASVLFIPVISAIAGFLQGVLMAVVYNFVVGHIGGLALEVDDGEEDNDEDDRA
jgi:uncharacterized oligopeptide transporter (OPT) family protein